MAKIELTRRRILGGLVTIGAGSAAAGAGTFALFSDTESDNGNAITAGTLDLQTGSPSDVSFSTESDIVPTQRSTDNTDWGGSVELQRDDTTSSAIAADLNISVTDVRSNEAGGSDDNGNLDNQLKLALWVDADNNGSFDSGDIQLNADSTGTTSQSDVTSTSSRAYDTASNFHDVTFDKVIEDFSDPITFYVDWYFPNLDNSTNNEAKGDNIEIDFEFELVQQN